MKLFLEETLRGPPLFTGGQEGLVSEKERKQPIHGGRIERCTVFARLSLRIAKSASSSLSVGLTSISRHFAASESGSQSFSSQARLLVSSPGTSSRYPRLYGRSHRPAMAMKHIHLAGDHGIDPYSQSGLKRNGFLEMVTHERTTGLKGICGESGHTLGTVTMNEASCTRTEV